MGKESTKNDRVRDWILTVPADGSNGVSRQELTKALEPYSDYAGQLEKGEGTGYLHWQIVVHHAEPVRFSTLRNKLPTAHLEPARDLADCYRYCTKEKTRVPDTFPLIKGDKWADLIKLKAPGTRSDLKELRSEILGSTVTLDELILTHPTAWQFERMCRALIEARDRKRFARQRKELNVRVFYGSTGTGKTSTALDLHDPEDICRVTSYGSGTFDSYAGHPVLILDEFRGGIPIGTLLNILDVYPMNLPARYGDKPAGFDTVYICSNLHPSEWFKDLDTVTLNALFRRFTELREFNADKTQTIHNLEAVRASL